jgi:8-oxo-dGTP pyrophosphatase MutT (NUDIX family)
MRRLRAVVTAGGTEEPIDDVRSVSNGSTGRFGAAIASALAARGVDVTVLGSERMLASRDGQLPGVRTLAFRSHADLDAVMDDVLREPPDLWFMAAAVADYAPDRAQGKIRSDKDQLVVDMKRTPKLLARLRARCGDGTTLVGFKLLSDVSRAELEATARRQLVDNQLDHVVANDLMELRHGRHPILLVGQDGSARVDGTREEVADALVAQVLDPRLTDAHAGPWTRVDGPRSGRARVWIDVDAIADDAEDAPSLESALAARRAAPDAPVAVRVGDRLFVGMGEHDLARASHAWSVAVAKLRARGVLGEALAVWHGGVLVAACVTWAGAWHLQPTGLDGDALPAWTFGTLAGTAHPAIVLEASLAPAWVALGFDVSGRDATTVTLTAPWHQDRLTAAASALLVDPAHGEVLLGLRRTGAGVGTLAPAGGHVEAGESAEQAARRELSEECGLSAPPIAPWFTSVVWAGAATPYQISAHVWLTHARPAPSPSDEFDARWVSLDAALRDPRLSAGARHVLRLVRDRLDRVAG